MTNTADRRARCFEEPAQCGDCGLWTEAENIIVGIIDQISGDTETFCPRCGSDYIIFHTPREDRDD